MNKTSIKLILTICVCLLAFSQANVVLASTDNLIARAISDGQNGVVVQWKVDRETNNLGFNVYRVDNFEKILINRRLVAGSSLINAEKARYFGDNVYSIHDPKGNPRSRYIIEAVDLEGKTETFGVRTELVESVLPFAERQSITLEDLTKSGGDEADAFTSESAITPRDKQFAALNENFVQNADVQKWVAAQPGAKIAVKVDGLYRVSRAQLAATNFNVNAPVANWQLFADGIEQPLIVEPNGNYIEFFGRGADALYTDTRAYYLVVGTTAGRRMPVNSRRLNASQVTAPNFSNVVRFKQRVNYSSVILNGDDAENFFGDVIINDPATNLTFNVRGIETNAAQAIITVNLRGLTTVSHTIRVRLNNTELGTMSGNFRDAFQQQFSVPTSLLVEGANTFSFTSSGAGDVVMFDSISISYQRRFTADANRLTFTTVYGRSTRVQGFTSSNIRVFDISDPNGTTQVNARIEGNSVFIPANRPQLLYAIADEAVLQPSAVVSNSPSTILASAANKDLVIISHGKFFGAVLDNLANYRRSQGLTVEIVNVEDVYDESGFGTVSPAAISSFLKSVNPKYALLIGDSSYDHRNYFNFNAAQFADYIPTRNFETLFGEAVSDDLIVDYNGDNIPDFPIGRLPIKDVSALQNILNKMQSFEANAATALLQKGATFVSDNTDGWDFYQSNVRIREQLPAAAPVNYIKRSDGDAATVKQMIINSINSGRYLIAYSGHGQISAWWSSSVFGVNDVASLTNTDYPLFLPMNCLNGAFADAFSESLGEAMIESPRGAVAVYSSSGLTFPDSQEQMAIRFFKALGTGEFARIGDAAKTSKGSTGDSDVRRSWILLGDPTLKIR